MKKLRKIIENWRDIMVLFILVYIVPFIVGCSSYLYLIYEKRCYNLLLGWILCMLPMVNLAWGIILVTDVINNIVFEER